jgi:hypothetical protein
MKSNELTLAKCAYIFHWSNNNYSWNKESYMTKCAIRARLKAFYEKNLPFTVDRFGNVTVELDGIAIGINDHMCLEVGKNHPSAAIINNITFKPLKPFFDGLKQPCQYLQYNSSETVYMEKLKSMMFDSFPQKDGLRYYCIRFKRNSLKLVVANRKMWSVFATPHYTELSPEDAMMWLEAESKAARTILQKFFAYICE